MGDIDEVSRILGRLQSSVESIDHTLQNLNTRMEQLQQNGCAKNEPTEARLKILEDGYKKLFAIVLAILATLEGGRTIVAHFFK